MNHKWVEDPFGRSHGDEVCLTCSQHPDSVTSSCPGRCVHAATVRQVRPHAYKLRLLTERPVMRLDGNASMGERSICDFHADRIDKDWVFAGRIYASSASQCEWREVNEAGS